MTTILGKMPDPGFKDFVLDQLSGLRDVTAQAMFGGWGLYQEDTFFGIVHRERLYLKVDDETRPAYEAEGMGPFQPNQRQTMQSYYEVPAGVLEDGEELVTWAREAVGAEP